MDSVLFQTSPESNRVISISLGLTCLDNQNYSTKNYGILLITVSPTSPQ